MTQGPAGTRARQIERVDRVADEKKPKTGVDENTERDEGLTPETEPTQSEISEGETPEESVTASTGDDTLADEVQNASTNDTEDADADDTLSEAETVGEGDPLSGDDTLAVSNEDDTVAHEPANSMESIHSVGEAVELDADEDTPAQAEDTLGSAVPTLSWSRKSGSTPLPTRWRASLSRPSPPPPCRRR